MIQHWIGKITQHSATSFCSLLRRVAAAQPPHRAYLVSWRIFFWEAWTFWWWMWVSIPVDCISGWSSGTRGGGDQAAAHMRCGMCWARRDLPLEAAQGGGGGGLWWCRRLRRCCGGGCAAERRAVKRRGRHIGICRWILFVKSCFFLRGWVWVLNI